jgi:hypothetical protein
MSQQHRHLIHREDLDKINEHLSQRAAGDAARSVGLGFLGVMLVLAGMGYGLVITDPNPKVVFSLMVFGVAIMWLGRNGNVHLNNPTDLT